MSGAGRTALKVFVGNVPWTFSSVELRNFASKFGPVSSAIVVFNKSTGMNKGFGFVNFETREGFEQATSGSAGSNAVEGNHLNIQPCVEN